ncbi:MAG: hypothetical protein IH598_12210 [Bacteroidales bacterium]|nr:hypothetical protein [Bacteroidales bacterium]
MTFSYDFWSLKLGVAIPSSNPKLAQRGLLPGLTIHPVNVTKLSPNLKLGRLLKVIHRVDLFHSRFSKVVLRTKFQFTW